jgi:glycosidase
VVAVSFILNTDWENGLPQYPLYPGAPLENNMFFGGNLDGVTKKLDYIASLGVNCIYLNPIFEAHSNHKYDTGNYLKIDDMFGGEEAFLRLLAEAKKRNIRIVLDGVFNHTGDDSIYFNRRGRYPTLGAYQSKDSPYYSWYDFKKFPDEYTCWWNIGILPRINTEVPSCREYFLGEDGVVAHYAKLGIGGFRLDVVDELPDSFVDGLKARLCETDQENILWGEVWEDASNKIAYGKRRRYFQGKQLDGAMNYQLRKGIIEYLRNRTTGALHYALCEVMPNAPKRVQDAQMNLFGTHDTLRILTALAGQEVGDRSNDEIALAKMSEQERALGIRRLKAAYLILATLPGVPHIYYGDEVGMEGYSDPFNRMPYPWSHPDEDLREFYRTVGAIRTKNEIYREGQFRLLRLDENLLLFTRESEQEIFLTAINPSETERTLTFSEAGNVLFGQTCGKGGILLPAVSGAIVSFHKSSAVPLTVTV